MPRLRSFGRIFTLAALVAAATSCGDVVRQGRSPVYLVVDSLLGATGGVNANKFGGTLFSDVQVLLTTPDPCSTTSRCPTIYADNGQVTFRLVPRDQSLAPTTNNEVTITRYHVSYLRADGRNTPGVDVPYAFDGAVTATVPVGNTVILTFELVRHTAKEESPLRQLISSPTIISTIAEVTFYGTDRTGNAISVTGSISIDFGDFGDA